MALLLAKAGSTAFVFALPRFTLQSATLPVNILPAVDGEPILLDIVVSPIIATGTPRITNSIAPANYRIFISNTPAGVYAFMNRCTHLGCVLPWSEAAGIFACPCHGSQFERNGAYIAGPASRALDRFPIVALDAQCNVIAQSDEAGVLALPTNAAWIEINHSTLLLGKRHA